MKLQKPLINHDGGRKGSTATVMTERATGNPQARYIEQCSTDVKGDEEETEKKLDAEDPNCGHHRR